MFGFLLKLVVLVAVVGGILGTIYIKRGSLPDLPSISDLQSGISSIRSGQAPEFTKNVNINGLTGQLSSALDSLVTHPNQNSPVVLGIKITNDSLNTLVDFIQNMPPEQSEQLKTLICSPASPSAQ